ncbi:hypothetical protein SMACR_03056 [Sordaria macrospora]|nr:hypothetical protein SMACR_03056 [Sordaria macrospora]WPJ61892.1 hypothetical protein SMAC4_03056 [Sordaria macrospora]
MIELKQGPDDKSVTVSDGNNSFSITFCEVPRAEDNGILSHQRVHDPYKGQGASLRPVFPFRVYDSPKLKDSRALAIKDDKAFAIRMSGDSSKSAFKVLVKVGGVNIIQHQHQHTLNGKDGKDGKKIPPLQDYFVVSEQQWIWGTQVGKDTARQFRVFGRRRERLSLRHQLHKNNHVKEVEIQITSRRPAPDSEADKASESATLNGSEDDEQQQSVSFAASNSNTTSEESPSSPHEMVIGTGGLICQVIARDKHPEGLVDDTKTIKFKIYNPNKPNHFRKKTGLWLGNPGGNWDDKPHPARRFFGRRGPVVEDAKGIRGDIKSPVELEGGEDRHRDVDLDSDVDSGVSMGQTGDDENEDVDEDVSPEEEERERFAALMGEARSQPREPPMLEKRKMKKKEIKKDEQQPPGVMQIIVLKRAGPVTAREKEASGEHFLRR